MTTTQGISSFSLSAATEQNSLQECIENCNEAHQRCLESIDYCLSLEGSIIDSQVVQTLLDCAQITQVSSDFLVRRSEFHGDVCQLCAEICKQCADFCSESQHEELKDTEEVCRRCSESCLEMQSHH